MHLDVKFSSINTKKQKPKNVTKAEYEQFAVDWKQHNKNMRKQHMHSAQFDTLEEYIAYRKGTYKAKKKDDFREYVPQEETYRRDTNEYKSLDTGASVAARAEKKEYTGSLLKGIATMHKSNAIPVIDDEHIKDISHMRR